MLDENKMEEKQKYVVTVEPIFDVPEKPTSPFHVFIAMPFRSELKSVYDYIKSITKKLNLLVKRADDFFESGAIIDQIWIGIFHSKLMIADCTNRNANVFYEIGIAHTLGKKVILITQNAEDVPSDLKHLRYIEYELTKAGMKEFEKKLSETLKQELKIIRNFLVVFISYAAEDAKRLNIVHIASELTKKPEIKEIQDKLPVIFQAEDFTKEKTVCSLKGRTLLDWAEWARKANEAADVFLIFSTKESRKSKILEKELKIANKYGKRIILVYEDKQYIDFKSKFRLVETLNIKNRKVDSIIEEIYMLIKKV
ncbi:MAG: hypothetical protein ACFFD2_05355 [Promethearchaeota archaeon]